MEEEKTPLEQRVAKVEGILEEIRTRLNHLQSEVGSLRQDMNREVGSLRQDMNRLRDRIDTQFRWLVGLMVLVWVTVILAILFAPK